MKVSIYLENMDLVEAQTILDTAKALRKGGSKAEVSTEVKMDTVGKAVDEEKVEAPAAPAAPAASIDRREPTPAVQQEIDVLLGAGFDWTKIEGTGKDGKITKTDVRKYAKANAGSQPAAGAAEASAPAPAAAPDTGVTVDDARRVLKKVSDEGGMEAAIEMLKKYGVSKVSDLEGDQLAAFVAEGS